MREVIIVGAGASGLVTAIISARRGKNVLVLEKNNRVGKKLLATGNGKCNITNQRPTLEHFYSSNPNFIQEVLEGYGYKSIKQFFRSIGLEFIEAKEGRAFPMSLQASSVVELLVAECRELDVEIRCEVEVEQVKRVGELYEIKHNRGVEKTKALVIATGHLSAPQLGGVDAGVGFAKRLGHSTIEPFPTLVQLISPTKKLERMAGVKVESRVILKIGKGRVIQKQGDVLFTSYGISGLAILDISRFVMEELLKRKSIMLTIDLVPKMSQEQLLALMRKSLVKKSTKPLTIWLQGFINKKLILPILEPLKLQNQTVSYLYLNREKLDSIVYKIKNFEFEVDGSRGYRGAEVVAGGVDTKEINPKTMESKRHKGLYFTGEVLDVDGDRGGFNLHFAWVCGLRAGKSI